MKLTLVVVIAALFASLFATSAFAQDPSELPPPPPMLNPPTTEPEPARVPPVVAPPVLQPAPPPAPEVKPPVLAPAEPEKRKSKNKNALPLRRGNGGVTAICVGAASTVAAPLACGVVLLLSGLVSVVPVIGSLVAGIGGLVALAMPAAVIGGGLYYAPDAELMFLPEEERQFREDEERTRKRAMIAGATAGTACVFPWLGACGGCLAGSIVGQNGGGFFGGPSNESIIGALIGGFGTLAAVGAAGTAANAIILDEPADEAPTTTRKSGAKPKKLRVLSSAAAQRY